MTSSIGFRRTARRRAAQDGDARKPLRYTPSAGLSVPIVTILDSAGNVLEDEQRAVVRWAVQDGSGADIIFAAGTTGEWDRLDNPRRQQVARVVTDECRRISAAGVAVEAWVGITAHTRAETLENLDYALDLGAEAAVVAPLSIRDASDPVAFVNDEIDALFERRGRQMPVFLYDNADIAAPGRPPHIHTRDVKQMSRMGYVRGIKVTAGKAVLGNYTRAAAHFNQRGGFAIYAGNPYLIFDLFAPPRGARGWTRHYWNRYWTRDSLPYGIVAGPANVMPREWRRALKICRNGDLALMNRYAGLVEEFRAACEFVRAGRTLRPTLACLKSALVEIGVCESAALAPGTPVMEEAERREFTSRFKRLRRRAAATLEPGWLSHQEPERSAPLQSARKRNG
jgi:dihydrodipicolinate synthase/N-acetylneuraminate lyase